MAQKKHKGKKQNNQPKYTQNVKKQEAAPKEQKISRDQRRKEKAVPAAPAVKEPDRVLGKISFPAVTLKIILLMVTALGICSIVFFDPETTGRQALRAAGIIGMPLAVFLLTEGYYHTESRWRYAGRLLLWGIAAELPNLGLLLYENGANQMLRKDFAELTEQEQFEYLIKWREVPVFNYLFTLLLALLFIAVVDRLNKNFMKNLRNIPVALLYACLLVVVLIFGIAIGAVTQTMRLLAAPIMAVMYVYIFVLLRERRELMCLVGVIAGLTFGTIAGPETGGLLYGSGAAIAPLLILPYNGRIGFNKEAHPYVKHAFYMTFTAILATLTVVGMMVFIKTHS